MAAPAFAGNDPEFDTVGCDSTNFFNDWIKMKVVCCNMAVMPEGGPNAGQMVLVNDYSDWWKCPQKDSNAVNGVDVWEDFTTSAGMLFPDPCFDGMFMGYRCVETTGKQECIPYFGEYSSALTDAFNEAIYTWRIILQKKPESDLNVNIVDCVIKHNEFDICEEAEQTGRYMDPGLGRFFVPTANPRITVKAYPGPYATPGFPSAGVTLDARQMPGLSLLCLDNACYTSKALWEEGLVVAMPETGTTNSCGDTMYNLKQGDAIVVSIAIPPNNTVDIFYGPDNIILKYIGIYGTYFLNTSSCQWNPCSDTECDPGPCCGAVGATQPSCG
jgi:hypothetical protein